MSWLSGWAAYATDALKAYAPASWIFGALLGGALFLLVCYFWAGVRLRTQKYRFGQEFNSRPHSINPLDDTFTRQRINLNDFATPYNEPMENKTFIECELRGPATVIFAGSATLRDATFVNCDFVKVKDQTLVFNVMPFHGLTVRGGKLINLTILVPASTANQIPEFAKWITL